MKIIGYIFTTLGYVSYWIGRFSNKKSIMMLTNSLSSAFFVVSHYCFGFYSAIASSILVVLRGLGVNLKDKQGKPMIWLYVLFVVAFTIVGVTLWNGVPTEFLMLCMYINITANWFFDSQSLRLATVVASVFYMISMYLVGNYVSMIWESTIIISNVVSYAKYRKIA